jgi:predicted nuclease with RNAse H fold
VVGIDLAGSPKRNTGVCVLRNKKVVTFATLFSDREILDFVSFWKPRVIAIDAPLNLPPGRKTLEDRNGEHFRPCDRELLRRGIRFFPITLGPMRSLTKRGILLKRRMQRRGFEVIEIYPGAAQDIWHIPRKQKGLGRLRAGLERLGFTGLVRTMNGDELDAVTGAIVGGMYLDGTAEMLGSKRGGAIMIPPSTERTSYRAT